ncbi:MAG: 4Fe-4S dicluster domain-containing protein [Gemmatimonadetes bacterium]|nr:4Fe-4S dicluster domain-containing protein [Gemmatimonadota bacterium]
MSDAPVDRRAFFQQGLKRFFGKAVEVIEHKVGPSRHIRPPGALPEAAFLGACTRCGSCMTACPVYALKPLGPETGLASGTPALYPDSNACVMCLEMPCAAACPTDALAVPETKWRGVRMATIEIDENRCLAFNDTECGVCAQVCPAGYEALHLDELGRPVLGDACTGCGTCLIACVTTPKSISVSAVGSY